MKYSHCTQLRIAFIIYSVHARASECLQCTGLLQWGQLKRGFEVLALGEMCLRAWGELKRGFEV